MNQNFGLDSSEAKRRHEANGPNEAVSASVTSGFFKFLKSFADPMGLMLLTLSGLYALLGKTTDSAVLFAAVIPVTAVDVILEMHARNALDALKATLKPTTKVLRDGVVQEIAIQEIVVGDVVVFEMGQALPADGRILQCQQLSIDESALTGESVPITKAAEDFFFGGTVVAGGNGLGLIERIGKDTKYGGIAKLLESTDAETSPLQKKVGALVKSIFIFTSVVAMVLLGVEYFRTENLLQSLIVAMTFGMAAVPEEFPLVFSLYLSLGAWRLSKLGVLVKSLPSVEALGSVDVICTDKTGTLTEGKFQLSDLYSVDEKIPRDLQWLCAVMACEVNVVDSMEMAILEKGKDRLGRLKEWQLVWDYEFANKGKYMSHVWRHNVSGQQIIAMKGAVEGVIAHCEMDSTIQSQVLDLVDKLAGQGQRILGLAYRDDKFTGDRNADEVNLKFIGILAFTDPIRTSASGAILTCQSEGIEIKMLTGDHPLTAHAVADSVGITHVHNQMYTGAQLSEMPKADRWMAYLKGSIFSRVLPEQKHEMVQALKQAGKVVAMTGDGINDAPALKLADIGISMGENASDVARSSAQMILLKNDFKGIAEAVFEGRRIFANLRRSFSYLISFHIPVILLALIPPTLGWGDLLLPIHIILLELIVHPVSAFAFENLPEARFEKEKGLLPRRRFWEASLSGVLLSMGSLALFNYFKFDFPQARSVAISAVLFGNIFFVLVESWPLQTKRFFVVSAGLCGLTCLLALVPAVAEFLHLVALEYQIVLSAFGVGALASLPSFLMRRRGMTKVQNPL